MFVAEAAITCYRQLDVTGRKVSEKQVPLCQQLVYVSYNHRGFTFKVPCCCYRAGVRAATAQTKLHTWARFYEDAHGVCHVQEELAEDFYSLKPAVHTEAERHAGLESVEFLPSTTLRVACGTSGAQRDGMPSSRSLSVALFFNTACPRLY